MKKNLLFLFAGLLLFIQPCFTQAQSVNDSVQFDNYVSSSDNDLVNFFTNTNWVSMNTSGGITGGDLQPPDSISWGNDAIQYCKNYGNVLDSMMETSVCFKFNSTLIHSSAFQRAADIFLYGSVINHYVIYSLNYNQSLTVLTYGYAGSQQLSLTSGHWYRLKAQYKSMSGGTGDLAYIRAEVFDLGTGGTSVPVSMGNHTATIHDSDLVNSMYFDVKVSGARYGGGELLDDFSYHGIVGTNNCLPTGIHENLISENSVSVFPQPAEDVLNIEMNGNEKIISYSLFDLRGREMFSVKGISESKSALHLKHLAPGLYFIEIQTLSGIYRKKVLIK